MGICGELKAFWKYIVIVGIPLILLPFVLIWPEPKVQCAYVVLLMAVYWMTAALPMGVTGLLPVFMFPMFGIVSVMEVATNYIKNIHLLLIGSMFVAIAIEQHGLHRRVALRALLIIGTSPRRLLFGIMLISGFLSFWLPNVAVTAMMVPIVEALVNEISTASKQKLPTSKTDNKAVMNACVREDRKAASQDEDADQLGHVNLALDTDDSDGIKVLSHKVIVEANDNTVDDDQLLIESKQLTNQAAMLAIAAAYASNIGGIATMIGTNPNVFLYELMEGLYNSHGMDSPLTYAMWLPMGIPSAIIALILCYILLQIYFLRGACWPGSNADSVGDSEKSKASLKRQQAELKSMSFAEGSTLFFFVLLILLFFFRDPGFMTGYGKLFGKPLTDAVPAILVATLLFIFPSKMPKFACLRKKGERAESVPALLEWKTSGPKLPWSALLLIGGAFAIEMGSKKSGLSAWLGVQLEGLESLPDTAVLCVCMLVVTIFTNITCGMATSSVFLPIYVKMANVFRVHPLYLAAPSCLMASSTFMLPASNPTNAIVYETGLLRIIDMVICGFFMNIIFFLVNLLGAETWMTSLFDLNTLPFPHSNGTSMPMTGGSMMMGH